MSTHAVAPAENEWRQWREDRAAHLSAPLGALALTGTHWLDDVADDGVIPGLPGHWRLEDGRVVHEVDGTRTVLETEGGRLTLADGRSVLAIVREGLLAVRVWDPHAAGRESFAGIETFDWAEHWVVPGVFRPYDESRTVRVPNADGRERGLGLGGELSFTFDGREHRLSVTADGSVTVDLNRTTLPWCAFSDAFICPFPPPGNTLPFALEAGERAVLRS
jgi:uncharacterized protein (DUF1684 family)